MQLPPQWLTRPNKQILRERSRSHKKLNKRIDCYVRPENCEHLQAPAVNPEVWKVLPTAAWKVDLKMVTMQTVPVKAATAVAQSTQTLFQTQTARSFVDSSVGKTTTKTNTNTLALQRAINAATICHAPSFTEDVCVCVCVCVVRVCVCVYNTLCKLLW